ncbi:OLC1v1033556C1 [Oldenlandia corymbosa var. corymbosa]|uniref:OLC1v1033556C1 n=1 Tax=Oldenlandia corymbosa var. corymbosa TaxID=529605 RepID=A0AAV1CQ65_OLDCO|nr:OLC1v1033556C1 [Oldenlandia corymbosa var. corymbosa]
MDQNQEEGKSTSFTTTANNVKPPPEPEPAAVCMNENCAVSLPSSSSADDCTRGWPLRSPGKFATLCRNCGAAYEQFAFCDLFHSRDSGWRECRSCGKRLHCGCIASSSMLELLDSGGVICISCSRYHGLCSNSTLENNEDFRVTSVNAVGENQLTSAGNQSNVGITEKTNLVQCCDDTENANPSLLLPSQSDDVIQSVGQTKVGEEIGFPLLPFSSQSSFEASHDAKPNQNDENTEINDMSGSLLETNLTISLPATAENGNLLTGAVVEERSLGKNIPPIPQGSKPLHLLPKPQKSIMAAGLETNVSSVSSQLRVARPPVEGRIKNQLLPRYWPRITDQELQKICGDSNSTVVPLFEKVLSASDAGRIGRLVLPKACAEAYFPPISQPEGLPLRIQDIKGKEWVFQFRFWPNNNSRMYVLEGVTPCIQSMQLQAGDTVTFSRMDPAGKLLMGFRKASNTIFMQDKHPGSSHKGNFSRESLVMPVSDNLNSVNGQPGCLQLFKGSKDLSLSSLSKHHFSDGDFGCYIDETNGGKPLDGPSERKKSRNIGSKSKRLLIDSVDALELKLSWEELQNMLCPPPSVKPSTEAIEDHEFEEYDLPPVFPKKSIFTVRLSSGKQEQWAQCDSCLKWRCLPATVILPPKWTCEDNTWSNSRSSCSVKDELSPEELENLLKMSIESKRQRMEAALESAQTCETSDPDGLGNPAVPAASVKTTTKHPRHRPGCSCIVCIQPPSGKGKHKPTCTCNVCMTVKRRFKTLMMRRKKRQSEREAEVAQRSNKFSWNLPKDEEAEVANSYGPPYQDNHPHGQSETTDFEFKSQTNATTLDEIRKGQQLDLNNHPGLEKAAAEQISSSARVSMITLLREASLPLENYLKQKGLTSLVSDELEGLPVPQAVRGNEEVVAVDQNQEIKEDLPEVADQSSSDGS